MAGLRISVFGSEEIQAVLLTMRALPRDLAKELRKQTRTVVFPEWKKAVAENASSMFESRVLVQTARATVTDRNVTLTSATVGRPLSGGLNPKTMYHAAEFGADQGQETTYGARSRRGKQFQVTRHTTRQLRPRKRSGYVVYPAAAEIIPRIASLWVQTIARGLHEAFERR
jgi:hypothetical protein